MPDIHVRHIQPDEFPAVANIVANVFSQGSPRHYERLLHRWLTHLHAKPNSHLEDYRVVVQNQDIVSVVRLEHHHLAYGRVNLRISTLHDVCTHGDARQKGYSQAVMRDSLAYLAERGAHLALLYDNVDYYGKFGFVPILPEYIISVAITSIPPVPDNVILRPATIEDVEILKQLYDVDWQGRLRLTRSQALWQWRIEASEPAPMIAFVNDRPVGYTYFNPDTFRTEAVALNQTALIALMQHASKNYPHPEGLLEWNVPPDSAIITLAQPLLPITVSATYRPSGGWMARMIDTSGLIQTLLPEVIAQANMMRAVPLVPRDLIIDVQPDIVEIGIRDLKRSSPESNIMPPMQVSHQAFIQLVLGALRPDLLALRQHLLPEHVQFLQRLFPQRMMAIGAMDML